MYLLILFIDSKVNILNIWKESISDYCNQVSTYKIKMLSKYLFVYGNELTLLVMIFDCSDISKTDI